MASNINSMSGLNFSDLNLDSSNRTNELEQNINKISKDYPSLPSTIEIKTYKTSKHTTYSKIDDYLSNIKETKIPYPNKDEIPIIKIKDENYFESGKKIILYKSFDDNKFSKCKICKNGGNKFFVKIVKKIFVAIAAEIRNINIIY